MDIDYEPCKKAKCISYPVCLQKETIKCYKLNHYIITLKISLGFDITKYDILWDNIDEILPKLRRAVSVNERFGSIIERHYNGYQVPS